MLRDWVILVVMASGTGKGESEKRFARNVRGIGQAVVLESLRSLDTVRRNRADQVRPHIKRALSDDAIG